MADRPILFSGPMVRALLAGTKTQTRRIFKPQPEMHEAGDCTVNGHRGSVEYLMREVAPKHWLRIKVGDRLWVRENAAVRCTGWHHRDGHWHQVDYAADYNSSGQWIGTPGAGSSVRQGEAPTHFPSTSHTKSGKLRWTPGIHVPRWASRLTLTVTDVGVERLQDCSEADAIAEGIGRHRVGCADGGERDLWFGIPQVGTESPTEAYAHLWDSINNPQGYCADDAPNGWEANPWVAAYTFTVEHGNIDQLASKANG